MITKVGPPEISKNTAGPHLCRRDYVQRNVKIKVDVTKKGRIYAKMDVTQFNATSKTNMDVNQFNVTSARAIKRTSTAPHHVLNLTFPPAA